MSTQDMCNAAEAFDLCRELPQWINRHRPEDGHRRYRAQELDYSFNGMPTLTVEVTGAQGRIAAYKSNIALIPGEQNPGLSFLRWWSSGKRARRNAAQVWGARLSIIVFPLSPVTAEAHARHIPNILLASGKLTEAKAGRPFFEALGWEIASPGDCGLQAGDAGLAKVLTFIAAQIGAAIALLPQSTPEAASPISFAMLRLPQPGNPHWHGVPAQAHPYGSSPATVL